MRKLLLPGVLVVALFVACENKSPVGPNGVGPGGLTVTQTTSTTTTTTTTTIAPTSSTSISSTTTSVVGSLARRYQAFPVAPNAPADMTLFFQLISTGSIVASLVERLPLVGAGPAAITENEYSVTGVYVMGNGTTGTVNGELGGGLNPLESGGEFEGRLTANVGSCVAEREFGGALAPQTLNWIGGSTIRDCAGSPLSMATFSLVRSDASAPLPTTTSVPTTTTTSVPPTTTTSSSTTSTTSTVPVCNYSLTPTGTSAPGAGGTGQVVIATLPTCPWTAQSFTSWLSVTPGNGSGPGSVAWTAQANPTGSSRSGSIVIAGQNFIVTQAAGSLPDYIPSFLAAAPSCGFDFSRKVWTVTINVTNTGTAAAAGASTTRLTFTAPSSPTSPAEQTTAALAVKETTTHTFDLPTSCFASGVCAITIAADVNNVLAELEEGNNSIVGSCSNIVPD